MIRRRHSKRNKALRKAIAKVIKWALITLFGWLLFKLFRPYAVRGYVPWYAAVLGSG